MSIKHATASTIVARFVGQSNTLTIPVPMIKLCSGDHLQALLLSQIIYWSERKPDTKGWFAKSYADWDDEICMSKYQVGRASKALVKSGFIKTKVQKSEYYQYAPTVHYCALTKAIGGALVSLFEMESREPSLSEDEETQLLESEETSPSLITETTAKTTTKERLSPDGDTSDSKLSSIGIPEIIKAWLDASGSLDKSAYNKTGYRKVAQNIIDAGYTPDDVTNYVNSIKRANFTPSLGVVQTGIAEWKSNQSTDNDDYRMNAIFANTVQPDPNADRRPILLRELEDA